MSRTFLRCIQHSIGVALLLLCCALPTRACLNDRDSDSLAEEAQGLPDVVQVIVGRFPRNPPLFYQMRIARVANEIKQSPCNFNLYDDIAVASDRLGRDDEAISWMEKKRAALPTFNSNNRVLKEHWYRYYANCGTFWAHRWLRAGADRKKIAQMVRARDMIAHAIQIKPNAHFGRERYQLAAINWIIKPQQNRFSTVRDTFLKRADFEHSHKQTIEGLSGLIVLGNAWESVDVFHALASAIQSDGRRSSLSYLARLRMNELIDSRHKSLFPQTPTGEKLKTVLWVSRGPHFSPNNKRDVETAYKALRSEAENWQKTRTKYMMVRLKQGRHPDTDKTFWIEYSNSAPPSLEQFTTTPRWWRVLLSDPTYVFVSTVSFFCMLLLILRDLQRRSRLRRTTKLI